MLPGTYTVKGHVSQGNKPGQMADCSAQFMVKAFAPPTIGCSASPSTVNVGDSSTITAAGLSPQNRPLTYSYSSTAGTLAPSSDRVHHPDDDRRCAWHDYRDLQRS